jgi:hypothetical protein
LFCYKAHDEKAFHLYEMNLDGTGVRRLTDGDYDDVDPIYLPDGHILFTTTRGNSHVRCGPFIYSNILARCDANGGNVYLISYNGEPDFVPSLLNDGRVIYSRWEYSGGIPGTHNLIRFLLRLPAAFLRLQQATDHPLHAVQKALVPQRPASAREVRIIVYRSPWWHVKHLSIEAEETRPDGVRVRVNYVL